MLPIRISLLLGLSFLVVAAESVPPSGHVDRYGDPLPAGALARLGTVRFRQESPFAVQFSPDGKILVSGGSDRTVHFWDPQTGKELRRFEGHPGRVQCAVLSANGKLLASGDAESEVRLWDAVTGQELHRLLGHEWQLDSLAFSPDGRLLASGDMKSTVRIWDTATGKALRTIPIQGKHQHYIHALQFSPDGKTLAIGGTQQCISLWDTATWKPVRDLDGHTDRVNAVAFSPDGKILYSCGFDSTVRRWDLATGKELGRYGHEKQYVRCLALGPDGRTLAAGTVDGLLHIWDAGTGQEIRSWRTGKGTAVSISYAPDGKTIATCGASIGLWDLATGQRLNPSPDAEMGIRQVAFSADGSRLAAGCPRSVHLWDVPRRVEVFQTRVPTGALHTLALAPDGESLAVGEAGPEPCVSLWEITPGQEPRRSDLGKMNVAHLSFSPNGKTLAGPTGPEIIIWDVPRRIERTRISRQQEQSHIVLFPPDGESLVSAANGRVAWLDPTTGKVARVIGTKGSNPFVFALSADGKTAAWGTRAPREYGFATGFALWEVLSDKPRLRVPVGKDEVIALALSPDGRLVATGGGPGVVRLWDATTGQEVEHHAAGSGTVWALAFSPDGRTLASGMGNSTVLLWDLARTYRKLTPLAKEPTPEQLDRLWSDLAATDAAVAYAALGRLVGHPQRTVPFLLQRLENQPDPKPEQIARWIADLDHEDFATRETASEELARLGRHAEEPLRQVLMKRPSAEMTLRLTRLLDALDSAAPAPQRVRVSRCIEALERIGSPSARAALATLSRRSDALGVEASKARDRIDRRSPPPGTDK